MINANTKIVFDTCRLFLIFYYLPFMPSLQGIILSVIDIVFLIENYNADIFFLRWWLALKWKCKTLWWDIFIECMKQKDINYQSIYCLGKILELLIETQYLLYILVYSQNKTVDNNLVLSFGFSWSLARLQSILNFSPSV